MTQLPTNVEGTPVLLKLAVSLATACDKLHAMAIRHPGEDPGEDCVVLPPMAEEHYRLALAALNTAASHFRLADYLRNRND